MQFQQQGSLEECKHTENLTPTVTHLLLIIHTDFASLKLRFLIFIDNSIFPPSLPSATSQNRKHTLHLRAHKSPLTVPHPLLFPQTAPWLQYASHHLIPIKPVFPTKFLFPYWLPPNADTLFAPFYHSWGFSNKIPSMIFVKLKCASQVK